MCLSTRDKKFLSTYKKLTHLILRIKRRKVARRNNIKYKTDIYNKICEKER